MRVAALWALTGVISTLVMDGEGWGLLEMLFIVTVPVIVESWARVRVAQIQAVSHEHVVAMVHTDPLVRRFLEADEEAGRADERTD